MLNQTQMAKVSHTVKRCLDELTSTPIHSSKEIAVAGKMLCEALNSMQDEVRFCAMKLPSKTECEELLTEIDKIVFKDTAPDDYEFPEDEEKRVCPRCGKQHKQTGGA